MAVTAIQEWLQAGHSDPGNAVHRQLLVISGSADVCYQRAERLISALPFTFSSCWVGPTHQGTTQQVEIRHAQQLLGQEFDVAVFDAHQPFRPSAFLALAGTIKSGGRLVILTPDLASWFVTPSVLDAHFVSYGYALATSPYIKRLQRALLPPHNQETIAHWHQHSFHLPLAKVTHKTRLAPSPFITQDQAQTFATAQQVLNAPDPCVVVTGPRGRGKSALLGLLAADLIKQGKDVALTSPVCHNTQAIFDIAQRHCNGERGGHRSPRLSDIPSGGRLQWFAPDNTCLTSTTQQCLIIDEAASLPLPVLRQLVIAAEQLILATTTQGYEGSGQGFLTRFLPSLERSRSVTHCSLKTPVRWFDNDPLEQFCEDNLLIADGRIQPLARRVTGKIEWSMVSFESLSKRYFQEVIQLLTTAHYQTTPDDIMRIVDAPDTFLMLGTSVGSIVGVCIVTVEGGERLTPISEKISSGERRVRGHLGAQRLSLISALPELACYTYWRINRIAVLPSLQNNGIGSQCLAHLYKLAHEQKIDALSSSFGTSDKLINFWQINDFERVAIGRKPDKASGERSAMVMRPLSRRASQCMSGLRRLFLYDTAQLELQQLTYATANDQFCMNVVDKRLRQFTQGSRSFDHLGFAWHYFLAKSPDAIFRELSADMGLAEIAQVMRLEGKRKTTRVIQHAVANFLGH